VRSFEDISASDEVLTIDLILKFERAPLLRLLLLKPRTAFVLSAAFQVKRHLCAKSACKSEL